MLTVDTHVLLDYVTGKIRGREEQLLDGEHWAISAAVLWEIWCIWRRNRIDADLRDPEISRVLSELEILPVTRAVAEAALMLDFTLDPVDEFVAATSIVYGAPLVTRDRVIRASKVVPLAG